MNNLTREQTKAIKLEADNHRDDDGHNYITYKTDVVSALCDMALGYLDVMPRPIEEAPKDGTFFYGWHRVWNCWIAVKLYENSWIEKTLCTQWPYDAFTHFIPLSSLPKATP